MDRNQIKAITVAGIASTTVSPRLTAMALDATKRIDFRLLLGLALATLLTSSINPFLGPLVYGKELTGWDMLIQSHPAIVTFLILQATTLLLLFWQKIPDHAHFASIAAVSNIIVFFWTLFAAETLAEVGPDHKGMTVYGIIGMWLVLFNALLVTLVARKKGATLKWFSKSEKWEREYAENAKKSQL